jgi:uncharacterized protein (DUF2147 family)
MIRIVLIAFAFLVSQSVAGQSIFGKWKTIDGQTNGAKSIVEIYEENGKIFGMIIDILNPGDKGALCKKCHNDEYNKPVLGLILIKNMQKNGKYYRKGTIFDPEHGKKFRCRLKLTDNPDVLQVRGYIAFLYATQYWKRVK